jgi:outer membrane protein
MTRVRILPILLLTLALVPAGGPAARADEDTAKIGVIDSQRIFAEYQEAKDAEAVFQDEVRQWRDEIEGMEREILSLQEKLRSQQLLLSQEKLDELQSEVQQKTQEYERKRLEYFDNTDGLAVKRNQELSQPINDQITLVVERLGAEGGFDLILDMATINVVYLAEGLDLTDKVLEELEKSGN